MPVDEVRDLYFEWLFNKVMRKGAPYRRLLQYMFDREFVYILWQDKHRYSDGIALRSEYARVNNDDRMIMDGPCTVLEMLVALCTRVERDILVSDSPNARARVWFGGIINNLGLSDMDDSHFNEQYTSEVIDILLSRTYSPDGRGGLFFIPGCPHDLREVEIWYQMMWYLNSLY